MRTRKEIKADILKTQEQLWDLKKELEKAVKAYEDNCKHSVTFERDKFDSHFDPGKMSAPIYLEWKERVCKRCSKILGKKYKKTVETWDEKWSKA